MFFLRDLQSALMREPQLRRLDRWNSLRVQHAKVLIRALAGSSLTPPELPADGEHNFHLFVVRTGKRDELRKFLQECGIETGIHYPVPIHLTGAYQALGAPGLGSLPVAEALADEILSFPMYAELSPEQVEHVVRCSLDFAGRI